MIQCTDAASLHAQSSKVLNLSFLEWSRHCASAAIETPGLSPSMNVRLLDRRERFQYHQKLAGRPVTSSSRIPEIRCSFHGKIDDKISLPPSLLLSSFLPWLDYIDDISEDRPGHLISRENLSAVNTKPK